MSKDLTPDEQKISDQAVTYIAQELKKGTKKDDIVKEFVKQGWTEESTLDLLAKAEQGRVSGHKMQVKIITETKCTCNACGNVWYYGKKEISDTQAAQMEEAGKAMACFGGCLPALFLPSKKVVDLDKCPKCGSRAVKKETVTHEIQ